MCTYECSELFGRLPERYGFEGDDTSRTVLLLRNNEEELRVAAVSVVSVADKYSKIT